MAASIARGGGSFGFETEENSLLSPGSWSAQSALCVVALQRYRYQH